MIHIDGKKVNRISYQTFLQDILKWQGFEIVFHLPSQAEEVDP